MSQYSMDSRMWCLGMAGVAHLSLPAGDQLTHEELAQIGGGPDVYGIQNKD